MSRDSSAKPASKPLDLKRLRLKSRADRAHKVEIDALAATPGAGASFADWLGSLPQFLGASALRRIVEAVVAAHRAGRNVLFAFGGHVVKTGCSPLIVDLIDRGIITAVATNGSGAIHDLELAQTGATSEDVAANIRSGEFGMVRETCDAMNRAALNGAAVIGLGRAIGEMLEAEHAPFRRFSILAAAARAGIPATVHVALGTDTVHMHGDADGAAIGAATMHDFRMFCDVVGTLGADEASGPAGPGGVFINAGSAVIMPEVFLKAVSVARNLGRDLDAMHTANFDMLTHYRPTQNVLQRPVQPGRGHSMVGQHEILLPLLRMAVIETLEKRP
ncbi:MAG: hypothetical protein JNG88_14120 [Phycisphaerales bacterium]|nr:hypothetical protein [Phycisphaerales bacterium]